MDIDKLRKRLETEQARQREAARKAQAIGAKLTEAARSADTRRKILAGSWALDRMEKSEEFRALILRELDRVWLSRDDDRKLFDFAPLSDEEKKRREIPRAPGRPRRQQVSEASASAVPEDSALSGGAGASRIRVEETEAA